MAGYIHVPPEQQFTAEEFLAELRRRGARVYRMKEISVFCLTDDPETAQWVLDLGGVPYLPRNATPSDVGVRGSYSRARGGKVEWDIYVHTIPVTGEETIWQAAGRTLETVDPLDFA